MCNDFIAHSVHDSKYIIDLDSSCNRIQIDKSKFGKHKYHYSSCVDSMWDFGMAGVLNIDNDSLETDGGSHSALDPVDIKQASGVFRYNRNQYKEVESDNNFLHHFRIHKVVSHKLEFATKDQVKGMP
ncbi:MAG: hypothetical protein EXX96DRAFT_644164 [Benjaminiella poitrasii]|nr:MAG: hypothetical protein EXX96DRAFT_644164 [Benjaminiella poitrasii]